MIALKRHSIASKVMVMIIATSLFLSIVIITAGAILIYNTKEESIRSEVRTAAHTLGNLYHQNYNGNLHYDGNVVSVGSTEINTSDFSRITSVISCEEDIDFTLFYNDTRVLTSVTNVDGSLAVGTKAADEVVEMVISRGSEYLYPRVLVNNKYYMGCYIPIKSQSNEVQGMIFAGKPLESAESTAQDAVLKFIFLAILALIISLTFCIFSMNGIAHNISDLKQFLGTLAKGDFSAKLDSRTVKRKDEIGELAAYMIKVRRNLKDMVERDPLTELLNRRGCEKRLEYLADNNISYAVVMGDIDYFKKINDTYGHAAGDYVLKSISTLLKKYVAEGNGFAARWGGEEFLMIFPNADTASAKLKIDRLLTEIREQCFCFEGSDIPVTMTFGISSALCGELDDLAINRADELLYEGKSLGRNTVMI